MCKGGKHSQLPIGNCHPFKPDRALERTLRDTKLSQHTYHILPILSRPTHTHTPHTHRALKDIPFPKNIFHFLQKNSDPAEGGGYALNLNISPKSRIPQKRKYSGLGSDGGKPEYFFIGGF